MSMTLISTVTVGAGGLTQIDFNSIPQTYTDLMFVGSLAASGTTSNLYIGFNGSGTGFSSRYLTGTGSAAASSTGANAIGVINNSSQTASTFGSFQTYVSNYTSTINKSFSVESVNENNATAAAIRMNAMLWTTTSAITSTLFLCDSTFIQNSTISLYGITKGSGGATVS